MRPDNPVRDGNFWNLLLVRWFRIWSRALGNKRSLDKLGMTGIVIPTGVEGPLVAEKRTPSMQPGWSRIR